MILLADAATAQVAPAFQLYGPHGLVALLVAVVGFFGRRELKRQDDDRRTQAQALAVAIERIDRRLSKIDELEKDVLVLKIQSDRLGRIRAKDMERFGKRERADDKEG